MHFPHLPTSAPPDNVPIYPMNSKTLLALGLCALSASIFAGCATQKTASGRNSSILGGLVEVNKGSYLPANANTIYLDGTKFDGRVNPSGDQVKLLWGAITYNDY